MLVVLFVSMAGSLSRAGGKSKHQSPRTKWVIGRGTEVRDWAARSRCFLAATKLDRRDTSRVACNRLVSLLTY